MKVLVPKTTPEMVPTVRKTSSLRNQIDYDKIVPVKSDNEVAAAEPEVKIEINKEKGFSLHRALCCLRTRRTS